jgi:hypothetical protein|tara:strand:- start:614 stop:853 length:240 start_codon:yes stop_codon:yes gene_type:complete
MSEKDDYITALRATNNLIDELMEDDLDAGASYTGIVTAVIYRLILGSDAKQDVVGIIGASMASAAAHIEMKDEFLTDIH